MSMLTKDALTGPVLLIRIGYEFEMLEVFRHDVMTCPLMFEMSCFFHKKFKFQSQMMIFWNF